MRSTALRALGQRFSARSGAPDLDFTSLGLFSGRPGRRFSMLLSTFWAIAVTSDVRVHFRLILQTFFIEFGDCFSCVSRLTRRLVHGDVVTTSVYLKLRKLAFRLDRSDKITILVFSCTMAHTSKNALRIVRTTVSNAAKNRSKKIRKTRCVTI